MKQTALSVRPSRHSTPPISVPECVTESVAGQKIHWEACLQFFLENLRAARRDIKTISAYQADIRIFRDALGKDLLETESQDICRVVEAWKGQGLAESAIQRRGVVVRQFYDLLFSAGLISIRPTANLRLPKPWQRVTRIADTDELERVIAAVPADDDPFHLRDRALLLLLRDTGPRVTAIIYTELSDIDWERGRLLLRHDKYGKEHWVPLSQRSASALRLYIEMARPYFLRGRDLPYLFSPATHRQGHLSRQTLWLVVKYWTERVLGKSYSPHKWRHICLTEGSAKGMDIFDLMYLAGHGSPETTEGYINNSIAELKKVFHESHPRARKERK